MGKRCLDSPLAPTYNRDYRSAKCSHQGGGNVAYLIAAALFWVGLIVSGLIYNQRRRNKQRCETIVCSRQSSWKELQLRPGLKDLLSLSAFVRTALQGTRAG